MPHLIATLENALDGEEVSIANRSSEGGVDETSEQRSNGSRRSDIEDKMINRELQLLKIRSLARAKEFRALYNGWDTLSTAIVEAIIDTSEEK